MKIPDDVFETRCRYCRHRQTEENREIPDKYVFFAPKHKEMPCGIMGISQHNKVKGECLSFLPNYIFGICSTCQHDNMFRENYCILDEQPNKRQLYIASSVGDATTPGYYSKHRVSTCDNYEVEAWMIPFMKKEAAEGRIPRNFNPETMQAIGADEETVSAEAWTEIERMQQETKKLVEKTNQYVSEPEQLSLFD